MNRCWERPRPCRILFGASQGVLALCLIVSLVAGCGDDGSEDTEDYGNILNSPAGLILVEEEHPSGWMRPDCSACHEPRNSHRENRTGIPECDAASGVTTACIDLAAIRQIVVEQGDAGCVQCHGNNGVEP